MLASTVLPAAALVCTSIGGLAGLPHESGIALDLVRYLRQGRSVLAIWLREAQKHIAPAHIMREGLAQLCQEGPGVVNLARLRLI